MNATRPMRVARASVFATMCLGISAAGHTWMSGRPVPAAVLVPGFALVFAVALAAAGRSRGFPPIASLMLAGEAGLHLLFSAGQTSTGMTATPGMAPMPGMVMPGMPNMPGMDMAPATAGLVPMSPVGAAGMVAVHAAAGLACAWWLHRGERAFFALVSWVIEEAVALLPIALGATPPHSVPSRPGLRCAPDSRVSAYPEPLIHILVRRGPPQVSLAG